MTFEIDRFPWLTLHVRRALSCVRRAKAFDFPHFTLWGADRLSFTARIRTCTVSSCAFREQEGTGLSAPLYFTRNGFEFSPEAVVTVREHQALLSPLGTVVVMLSFVC